MQLIVHHIFLNFEILEKLQQKEFFFFNFIHTIYLQIRSLKGFLILSIMFSYSANSKIFINLYKYLNKVHYTFFQLSSFQLHVNNSVI